MAGKEIVNRRLTRYHIKRLILNFPRFINFACLIWAFLRRKSSGKYPALPNPLILMIESTNFCNFNCPLCDKGAGKLSRPEGSMSVENYQRLLEDIGRGLKLIMLWNQGEPFINKQLLEMVKFAKERGIFTVISTNGSLIMDNAEAIVKSGLDELIISLDGATRETYYRFRRGGDFESIINGIKHLAEIRGRKFTPLISLQFLLLKHNINEMDDFKCLADKVGADRILWKTVQVSDEMEAIEYIPNNLKYSRYSDKKGLQLKRKRYDCRRILYSAVVDWNGNVIPCCFDKDEEFVMGNAFEQGFTAVWRGEKFVNFRDLIAAGKYPPMCANCTEGLEKLFVNY